jgi:uncharacterized protein
MTEQPRRVEPPRTVISVRGDAQLEVPPDLATTYGQIRTVENSKAAALQRAAEHLEAVQASLRELGGVPLVAGDERRPLTWLARSASSYPKVRWDKETRRRIRTGRVVTDVDLRIHVRDFDLSDPVAGALAGQLGYHAGQVAWSVDRDNPGWRQVRNDAISAAVEKARDYAAALHGTLLSLDHLADVGLLGGKEDQAYGGVHAMTAGSFGHRLGGRRAAPSLDPEPQLLSAAVEARFSASVADLGADVP